MDRKLLWELFVHTGKIEYYLKYKEIEDGSNSRKKI